MLVAENRAYRKNLSSYGLIYLGFSEYSIKVINLSLTGFLAQLSDNHPASRIKDIFRSLQVSPRVDIYLPDLRIAGEAEAVRVEENELGLQIGIEFRNLSYDVGNLMYERRAYRRSITELGQLMLDGLEFEFTTENVSVNGLMVRIAGEFKVDTGDVLPFTFKQLDIQGEAEVLWVEKEQHATFLGLSYVHLERDFITTVPQALSGQTLSI
ncbi:MAG: PilZ domain-containing protein [Methylomonas lenta]|nr:PilZ domain-containing protein [Methylomonas lenta]